MKKIIAAILTILVCSTAFSQDISISKKCNSPIETTGDIIFDGSAIKFKNVNLKCNKLKIKSSVNSITVIGEVKIDCNEVEFDQANSATSAISLVKCWFLFWQKPSSFTINCPNNKFGKERAFEIKAYSRLKISFPQ